MDRRSGSTALSFAAGIAVGLAITFSAWRLYNRDQVTLSNFIIGIFVGTAVALVWHGRWRALGAGLLSSLVLYVLTAILIFIWASGLAIA